MTTAKPLTTWHRWRASAAVLAVVAAAVAVAWAGIAPVRSQSLTLEAAEAPDAVPVGDPWSPVWESAPSQEIPLSEQNVAPPFGGGSVDTLIARALYDADRLYLLVEWSDAAADAAVNANEAFTDAVAVQFPTDSDRATPYTMGSAEAPVNIWQWKAVWQRDIAEGFATGRDLYPNTYVDFYPNDGDETYLPALELGNALAQRERDTPVENLIAAGFGTLTNADVQDVAGSGEWRDGTWRVVFARDLEPSAEGMTRFASGEATQVAFAVWDGAAGDRNGQKSLAQFVDLSLGAAGPPDTAPPPTAPPPEGPVAAPPGGTGAGSAWLVAALILGGLLAIWGVVYAGSREEPPPAAGG